MTHTLTCPKFRQLIDTMRTDVQQMVHDPDLPMEFRQNTWEMYDKFNAWVYGVNRAMLAGESRPRTS